MPTAIVVYEKAFKKIAKNVSKSFGDIKNCEPEMLNLLLKHFETTTTAICNSRPYMVAKKIEHIGEYVFVEGFMKHGLRSDKVIVNGKHLGVVEVIYFDDFQIQGPELNEPEDERNLKQHSENDLTQEDNKKNIENNEIISEESNEMESEEYIKYEIESEEEMNPEFDLIEKYKDYRGIRNLATCDIDDENVPNHYKDLIYMRRFNFVEIAIKKQQSKIPSNSYVKLKLQMPELAIAGFFVLFGLYAYETRATVSNYEFISTNPISDKVVIDNGYRIFESNPTCTCNHQGNAFKVEQDVGNGIISFLAPFLFFTPSEYCYSGDNVSKLYNGESYNRKFFDCIELTGRPVKVLKRYCIIKGMFYTKEQAEYFSTVRLEAKNDNFGLMKKALGTKCLFKAFFTHRLSTEVNSNDAPL
jgi:hypothetical protein